MSSDRWQVAGRYVNLDGSAVLPARAAAAVLRWKSCDARRAVFDGRSTRRRRR
ncbi:MAG: hypothetical protein R3F65_31245 [bacterium]